MNDVAAPPLSFRDTIARQRMIRPPYQDRPVPRTLLERLLLDSRKAPSAGFSQGASFVVLEGDQVRWFFDTTLPDDPAITADAFLPCPVVILPMEDKAAYLARYSEPDKQRWGLGTEGAWPVPYWTVDTAFATMTLLLSATAHGLGGWFFGVFKGERELLAELGVPDGIRPIGAVALGFPSEEAAGSASSALRARKRPDADVIRWGRW